VNVLQMNRRLAGPPTVPAADGVTIRTFTPADIAAWLALRTRAFATETPPVRSWTTADFDREMTRKPWWRDEHTWLAFPTDTPGSLVGAVTLATRKQTPVIHWMMVDPDWRGHGIGQLLLRQLERTAWDKGVREIRLETHHNWHRAVQLYTKLGYEVLPHGS
jgi:GNAT superfamily N-acetyltransferase